MAGDTDKQKFTVEYESVSHEQVAATQKQLADGQRELDKAFTESEQAKPGAGEDEAKKIKETADATRELTAKEEDLKQVLNAVHPSLGALFDTMGAGLKVVGDLGTSELKLTDIIGKGTAALDKNLAAYTTLAAGGAVLLGLEAIADAWETIKKKAEAAAEAANKYLDAQSRLKEERAATRGELVDRLIGLDVTSQEGIASAENIAGKLKDAGFGKVAVDVAPGLVAAGVKPGDIDTIMNVAAATEAGAIDPSQPDVLGQLRLAWARNVTAGRIRRVRELRIAEAQRRGDEAQSEWESGGVEGTYYPQVGFASAQLELPRLIEEHFGKSGDEAERMAKLAKMIEQRRLPPKWMRWYHENVLSLSVGSLGRKLGVDKLLSVGMPEGLEGITDVELTEVGELQTLLRKPPDLQKQFGEQAPGDPSSSGGTHHHYHDYRGAHIYPDRAGRWGGSYGSNFQQRTGIG